MEICWFLEAQMSVPDWESAIIERSRAIQYRFRGPTPSSRTDSP